MLLVEPLGQRGSDSTAYNLLAFVGLWCGLRRRAGLSLPDRGAPVGSPPISGCGSQGRLDVRLGIADRRRRLRPRRAPTSALIRAAGDHADLGHEATTLSGHGLGVGFVAFAFAAGIGAPIAEEIFFRGLTQPVLQRYLGGAGGLAVTAVLFGFAHASGNPKEVIVPLAVFGAMVGALAWRTGRLGPGIVAHITFNGITVVALALSR